MKREKQLPEKANRFLITISQIGEGESKQEPFDLKKIEDTLKDKFAKKISYYCIGRERHKDKGWHTHVYLHLKSRIRCSKSMFDFIYNKEADVQVIKATKKDQQRALRYTRKGQDFIQLKEPEIDIKNIPIKKAHSYVLKAIQEGVTYNRLLEHESPQIQEYVTKHPIIIKKLIQDYYNLHQQKKMLAMPGIKLIDQQMIQANLTEQEQILAQDPSIQSIIRHINIMSQQKGNRRHKEKNLLLWSKKVGLGKTSLFIHIAKYCPAYGFPIDEWFEDYQSHLFWMIYWNEMTLNEVDLSMFNSFLEGIPVRLKVKGSSVTKTDNPHVFMTSNRNLKTMLEERQSYDSIEQRTIRLNALLNRIEEVNIDHLPNIFFLSKLIVPTSFEVV